MRFYTMLFLLCCYATIPGCSAVGVPATDDPQEKLNQSLELFQNQLRPIPAERLIRESIRIYQAKEDSLGLAEAYRMYGIFFRSRGVIKWEPHYRNNGFMDSAASYDQRYDKSIEYLGKARDIYLDRKLYDKAINIHLNMAHTYALMNQIPNACASLNQGLENYHQAFKEDPRAQFSHPPRFKSFDEYVQFLRKDAGCP